MGSKSSYGKKGMSCHKNSKTTYLYKIKINRSEDDYLSIRRRSTSDSVCYDVTRRHIYRRTRVPSVVLRRDPWFDDLAFQTTYNDLVWGCGGGGLKTETEIMFNPLTYPRSHFTLQEVPLDKDVGHGPEDRV